MVVKQIGGFKTFAIFALLCWISISVIGIRLKHLNDARQ